VSVPGIRMAAAMGVAASLVVSGCVTPQTRFAPGGAAEGYAYLIGGSSKPDQTNYWIASVTNDQGRLEAAQLSSADAFVGIAIEAGRLTVAGYRINAFQGGGNTVVLGPRFMPKAGRCYIAGFDPLLGGGGAWVELTELDRSAPTAWGSRADRPRMREVGPDDGLWAHCEKVERLVPSA